jgi:tetratricopeptide (TPR) repeat protein
MGFSNIMGEEAGTSLVGRTVGQYRIVQLIGRGGMGRVYLGHDDKLKRDVAVKVLPAARATDPEARAQFVREARWASRVVHPYVATLLDVAESGDDLFLIMEHLRGRTLASVLDESTLTPAATLSLASELAEALGAIHRAGLVHRDLKPANVMMTDDGHVKVMDFGVARAIRAISSSGRADDETVTIVEDAAHGAGTVVYMSPEQLRGARVDARSDLFALGDILYEALTGAHPFARPSLHETVSAILDAPPGGGTEPETLTGSGPLRSIVLRLLEKDPERRYDSADAVLADLRAIHDGVALLPSERPHVLLRNIVTGAAAVALSAWALWAIARHPWSPGRPAVDRARPGILVLPFEGASASADDASRGAMMASLLRADLASVPAVRVVGSTRTEDLVAQSAAGAGGNARGERLASLAAVRYLVSGRYAAEGPSLKVAVDVYDGDAPDRPTAFVAQGASLASLVSDLAAQLCRGLGVAIGGDTAAAASLASFSDGALIAAERGRVAADRGDLAGAGRAYDDAVAADPRFVRAHLERARVLYDAGFVNRARESVDAASAVVAKLAIPLPERSALRLAAIRAQVDEKREDEIAAWTKIAAASPDDPDAWVDLSDALGRANLPADALAAIDKATAARPKDASILLKRAHLLLVMRKLDEAAAALAAARAAGPHLPTGRWAASLAFEEGNQLRAANKFVEARAAYEQARGLLADAGEPQLYATATRAVGETLLREGDPSAAIPYFISASDTLRGAGNLKGEANALDALGATQFQLGRYTEAERTLRQAIGEVEATDGLKPRPTPYLNLASLLAYTGRFDEAAALAAKAAAVADVQKDEKRAVSALLQGAVALAAQGHFEDAATRYETTIQRAGLTPPDERAGWALSGLAEVSCVRGELTTALEQADRSVAVQRGTNQQLNVAYALVGRARIRTIEGDTPGAAADVKDARDAGGGAKAPADLVAHIDLDAGLAALETGDNYAAESAFRKAAAAPTAIDLTGFAHAGLAEALCRSGRADLGVAEAHKAAESPATFNERLEAGHALAECERAVGRRDASLAVARRTHADAEPAGARWAVVISSIDILKASPSGSRPPEVASGTRALDEIIARSPGGADGSFARRAAVRDAVKTLGTGPGTKGAL